MDIIVPEKLRDFLDISFKDKKYKHKDYVTGHLIPVAELSYTFAERYRLDADPKIAFLIGLLHDFFEDVDSIYHDRIIEYIENYFEENNIRHIRISDILSAMQHLTHDKTEVNYYYYIHNIDDPYALIVKKADLTHNIKNPILPNFKKLPLYLFALDIINGKIKLNESV